MGAAVPPAAACGLAIGTKLTALAFVGVLTLAMIWIAGPGTRVRVAAVWVGTLAATGGLSFLRNLI